jgi:hypothetical protein
MAEIVDLRGRQALPAGPPILADPSGRRARMLARAGRVLALVFLLWITGLGLAGLGILPAGFIPLGGKLGSQAAPPVIAPNASTAHVTPAPGTTAGSAVSAASGSTAGRASSTASAQLTQTPGTHPGSGPVGQRSASPGSRSRTGAGTGSAGSGSRTTTAPGQTVKQSSLGHSTATTAPGSSGAAPGQTQSSGGGSTTAPGQTGATPGQTATHGSGHGNNN